MTDRPLCLITGASGGIGAACATLAAARGYDIALTYNSDLEGAQKIIAACEAEGVRTHAMQIDVAEEVDINRMYAEIDDRFGRIDALVNNAGIAAPASRVSDMSADRIRRMFNVNVIGAMLVAQGAIRRMEPAGRGVIVNITSVAARLGSGNQFVDYAASKAAIDTFTKGLSDEVAEKGLRVMAVAPGMIETGIHAKTGDAGRTAKLAPTIPMRRVGTPEEVAETVLWLLSDQASYLTGSTLNVSGGR